MVTRTASQIERAAHGEIHCDRVGTTIQSYPHHRTHSVGRHYGRRLTTGRTKRWRTLSYYTWSIWLPLLAHWSLSLRFRSLRICPSFSDSHRLPTPTLTSLLVLNIALSFLASVGGDRDDDDDATAASGRSLHCYDYYVNRDCLPEALAVPSMFSAHAQCDTRLWCQPYHTPWDILLWLLGWDQREGVEGGGAANAENNHWLAPLFRWLLVRLDFQFNIDRTTWKASLCEENDNDAM